MRAIREIKLTNTLSGKKEVLETLEPGKLKMYSCGPTVYGLIHIGNLRGGLVADLFFRYFKRVGYDVTYVRNYTDVDDKIIKRAAEEKTTADEIARKYIVEVERDYAVSGMLEPTHKTTVRDHIAEIIEMIEKIIESGRAYVIDTGEVLFSIEKADHYGKLSHKNIEELQAGIRVEVNAKKRNPMDFTLWKPAKPGEPAWDSPWGKGRPGWHIECSAMASKWLGDTIDVHHGGEDLIFPHHENEIAQSEAASHKTPFSRYWLHHAFLTLSKEKMSKSLGNIFTAQEFLKRYGGEVARYMLLSVHYRSLIDFGNETIEHTLQGLHRIYEAKALALEISKQARARADLRAESVWGEFAASSEAARKEIDDAYANDFNTAGALGSLFTLIRAFNRAAAEPLARATPSAVLGATELLKIIDDDIGGVIGVGRLDPRKALEDISRIRAERSSATGTARPTETEILALIAERAEARKAKNFARSDEIRKELDARGVTIKDGAAGTTWDYK
ncbi:MAG: cysteine--tRNA ligase [Oligoflexia bacterium]|nr:cysteine--tRNA ligase [Oligoflexia bacterium]